MEEANAREVVVSGENDLEFGDNVCGDENELLFGETEFAPEEIAAFEAADEREALAAVFADVREASADGRLVAPEDWMQAGLVPDHMEPDAFEMFVYEYLEEHRADETAKPVEPEPTYRTATRAVGVPRMSGPVGGESGEAVNVALEQGDSEVASGAADANGAEPVSHDFVSSEADSLEPASTDFTAPVANDAAPASTNSALSDVGDAKPASIDFAIPDSNDSESALSGFVVPEGFELVELEGELTLVPIDEDAAADALACDDIAVLVGKRSYYLYAKDIMTDRYAHWAFLAREDDRIVTFVECVREEARTYPRPMSIDGLKNEPFSMSDEEIEETWNAIRKSGAYPDIETTKASNGDVFFYSTEYLSPAYAASLAEWHAVERGMYL